MNRMELAAKVAERTELTVKQSSAAITAMLDAIAETIADGEDVSLYGFGTFRARERSARVVQHPTSGKTVQVPAGRRVTFSAALALRRKLVGDGAADKASASKAKSKAK